MRTHFLRNFERFACRPRSPSHLLAKRTHATGGLILLDWQGNPGFAFNTPRMAYGYVAPDGSLPDVGRTTPQRHRDTEQRRKWRGLLLTLG